MYNIELRRSSACRSQLANITSVDMGFKNRGKSRNDENRSIRNFQYCIFAGFIIIGRGRLYSKPNKCLEDFRKIRHGKIQGMTGIF